MESWNKVLTSALKSMSCLAFSIFMSLIAPLEAKASPSKKAWQETPSAEDWKTFMALNESGLTKEWKAIRTLGLSFDELAWEWRLGWVRSCSTGGSQECGNIMQLGLFDKALVVRAEAATRLGQRFAGTGHPPAIRLLRTAYSIQQNSRSKEPLFVQYRILAALNQIGGEGRTIGKQLSLNSNRTSQYWTRIASK